MSKKSFSNVLSFLITFILVFLFILGVESQNLSFLNQASQSKLLNDTSNSGERGLTSNYAEASLLEIFNISNMGTKDNLILQRKRRQSSSNQSPICYKLPSLYNTTNPPVLCYQCKSSNAKEECDSINWNVLEKGRKYRLRIRCPTEIGAFCVKKVQEQSDKRVTERGCYGIGPETTLDGNKIKLKAGCVSYHQNGFSTRTCLCNSDLCNSSGKLTFRMSIYIVLFMGFLHF